MTETKDLREEILSKIFGYHFDNETNKDIAFGLHLQAMDEYADKRMEQLLEWMAKNNVKCDADVESIPDETILSFKYKGEWITASELIKNFL